MPFSDVGNTRFAAPDRRQQGCGLWRFPCAAAERGICVRAPTSSQTVCSLLQPYPMPAKKNKPFENVLILGIGGVGYYLAKRLAHEGHAITAIEPDSELIRIADSEIDARLIKGDALQFRCWKEADAAHMDYMIAVTDNDAVNILSSLIADRFGIARKIARIRSLSLEDPDAVLSAEDLKIDLVIHPEELTAQEIVRLIKLRAGNVVIDIAEGRMQVLAARVTENSPLADKSLREIFQLHGEFPFRIVAIARGITTIIPGGDEKILPQDQVVILAGSENLPRLMALTGVKEQRRHRVMILGGGLIGRRVAELLETSFEVKLIEKDEKCAEELSFTLKNAEILHGDGSNAKSLNLAGLLHMDTIITATGDNETNIMSCLLAKHLMNGQDKSGKGRQRKTIALVDKEEYLVLAGTMGADIALNKKVLAGNEILKFIRREKLLSVAPLHGFDAEVVDLVAEPGAPITGKPLYKQDHLKGKILIGGVFRDGVWQIAVGGTHIQPGEEVIAVCTSAHLKDVQRLFLG